jgi:glycosyltransferase involved in cell wall biosynthesis
MLKVSHIISGDLWAGAEVMAYNLLQGLKAYKNLSLSAILLNEGQLAEKIRKLGIPIRVVDEKVGSFFHTLFALRKTLSQISPDLIHSHRYKENILGFLACRGTCNAKLISTHHGMPEVYEKSTSSKHRFVSRLNVFLLSNCFDCVVTVSREIQRALVNKLGISEEKVMAIHNGIEIPESAPKKQRKRTFLVGSAGRLFPVKDYPLMVEIARAVRQERESIHFQLAGDGPELAKLQRIVKKYGLNGIFELKGHIADISSFYRGLDLYLNTSVHEGIPMSMLEAMAHELPVIAPNIGGLSEILDDGLQGYLLDTRDPQAFAEKCLHLYYDKSLRQKMSRAAKDKVVQRFSMGIMAKKYHGLYLSLGHKGGKR